MRSELEERTVSCPYCGELIEILIDTSMEEQNYIEDCEVCCRPITIKVTDDENNNLFIEVLQENEVG
jgi:hypothetical protein